MPSWGWHPLRQLWMLISGPVYRHGYSDGVNAGIESVEDLRQLDIYSEEWHALRQRAGAPDQERYEGEYAWNAELEAMFEADDDA